ncbi:hypothetical protein [Allorhizocola rhizosphaerae]|uniref:hypothetical protein n=1 Tax=Allorhizocola rhizosphaerae TaxID=1872709 RepID=UPI0013C2CF71
MAGPAFSGTCAVSPLVEVFGDLLCSQAFLGEGLEDGFDGQVFACGDRQFLGVAVEFIAVGDLAAAPFSLRRFAFQSVDDSVDEDLTLLAAAITGAAAGVDSVAISGDRPRSYTR